MCGAAQHATDDVTKLGAKAANEVLAHDIENNAAEVTANFFWDAQRRVDAKREHAATLIQRCFRKRKVRQRAEARAVEKARKKSMRRGTGKSMSRMLLSRSGRFSRGPSISSRSSIPEDEFPVDVISEDEELLPTTIINLSDLSNIPPSQLEVSFTSDYALRPRVLTGPLRTPKVALAEQEAAQRENSMLFDSKDSESKITVWKQAGAMEAGEHDTTEWEETEDDLAPQKAGHSSRLSRARQANASRGRSVHPALLLEHSSSINEGDRQSSREEPQEVGAVVTAALSPTAVKVEESKEERVAAAAVVVRVVIVKAAATEVEAVVVMNVVAMAEAKATLPESEAMASAADELKPLAVTDADAAWEDDWCEVSNEGSATPPRPRSPSPSSLQLRDPSSSAATAVPPMTTSTTAAPTPSTTMRKLWKPAPVPPGLPPRAEAMRWLRESVAAAAALDLEAQEDESSNQGSPAAPLLVSPSLPAQRAKATRSITMADIERRSAERRKLERAKLKASKVPAISPTWREAYSAARRKAEKELNFETQAEEVEEEEEEINRKLWGV